MNGSLRVPKRTPDRCRRFQLAIPRDNLQVAQQRRVRINVRGFQFETFQATLEHFPDTMLGCPTRRIEFYDPVSDQYCLDRDPAAFDFILFFYQSNGILSRPETISKNAFSDELKFFGITEQDEANDGKSAKDVHEASTSSENQELQLLTVKIPSHEDDLNCTKRAQNLRTKCWLVMEYPRSSLAGKIWGRISISVILLSVFAFCLETMPELNCPKDIMNKTNLVKNQSTLLESLEPIINGSYQMTKGTFVTNLQQCSTARTWFVVETTIVIFFLMEYLIRFFTAPSKCSFVLSLFGIVDMAAIAPYFITLAVHGWRTEMNLQVTSFSVLRIVRLCRVLRVFKLSRYSDGLKIVGKTFSDTWRTLSSLMMCVLMAVVLFSSFLFYFEEKSEAIGSIVENSYWALITMTTVGYGDIVPRTLPGKLTASACMVFGIVLLLILPLPVFVTHFCSLYEEQADKKRQNQRRGAYETPTLLEKLMTKH